MTLRILAALTFCWLLAPVLGAAEWSAGAAKINITPGESMWMSGYANRTRPAEGKLTDLWVKALALDDGQGRVAVLLTADLIGIDRELSLSIRNGIASAYGLPQSRIVLNCSHTHSGPVVGNALGPQQRLDERQRARVERYAVRLRRQMVEVAGEALQSRTPCRLAWAVGHCSLAVNRRENREQEVPRLRAAGQLKGPVDHSVPVLAVSDSAGVAKAIVFGYACHATVTRRYEWSADYPGYAQQALEASHPQAIAMFWAGCGADQNPLPRRRVELARSYGSQLASAVQAVLEGNLQPVSGPLRTRYREVPLAFGPQPSLAETRSMLNSSRPKEVNWARLILALRASQEHPPGNYPYPVAVWQLGDGPSLVFLGGEVVVDYALRLQAELDGQRTWVAGYSNDVMNYIPSHRVFREGGYEGLTGMITYGRPAPWTPDVEDTIIRAVHELTKPRDGEGREVIKRFAAGEGASTSAAVSVEDVPLVHTGLLRPVDQRGVTLGRGDTRTQTRHLFQQLQRVLAAAGSSLDRLVQVNFYTSTPAGVQEVQAELRELLGDSLPAATFVAGDLPGADVLVTLDAVAASELALDAEVRRVTQVGVFHEPGFAQATVLPPGERLYLSGWINRRQAPLPELVDETLEFQLKLLRQLGSRPDRVVRIRAFLKVKEQYAVVRDSVARAFQERPLPPVVYAPWGRPGVPEIEFIVAGRTDVTRGSADKLEYFQTPGRPPSPVFSRAARVQASRYLYLSGIVARQDGGTTAQMHSIFEQLQATLRQTGSDLRHMVKATYWLADRDAAQALGQIRRELYDPQRPPAASAFTAQSVGFKHRAANVDMIAIPAVGDSPANAAPR